MFDFGNANDGQREAIATADGTPLFWSALYSMLL